MNVLASFAPGLAVRILLTVVGNLNPKAGWALIGLWDGYAVHQMSGHTVSSEAPILYGLLFLVDFYISHSFYKTAIIFLWTLLGMIITDLLSPQHWYDTSKERKRGRRTSRRILEHAHLPSSPRLRSNDASADVSRQLIEEQTAVTFAARSATSLSSDLTSLVSSDSETSRENLWDYVPVMVSAQPISSGEDTQATMHASDSTTRGYGHSSDHHNNHLPSPPDTFPQQTPHITDILAERHVESVAGAIPGSYNTRDVAGESTSPSSPPPLMVPSIHVDPPLSQGTLLSSEDESLLQDLLSPLEIHERGSTPHSDVLKIIPPRRSTPMLQAQEVLEPVVTSSQHVGRDEEEALRLTESEESGSSSQGSTDYEALVKRANIYRKRAKDHENEIRKLRKELKAASEDGRKRHSIVLRNKVEHSEEQAHKFRSKADSLFFRVDNPSPSWVIDLKRVTGAKMAVREVKRHLERFFASNEASTNIRMGTIVRNHEVRQAILTYLSESVKRIFLVRS